MGASRSFSGDNITIFAIMGFGLLLWQKLSGTVDKVGGALEIGKNSGGIAQAETTQEIDQYTAEVKSWHCDWRALGPAGKTKCKAIANKIYAEAREGSDYLTNLDEDLIINLLKPLNANELRAVAISFGVKDINNFFGFTVWTGHIFHFFDTTFTDTMLGGNDLTTMRQIWSKTGLWI